MNPPNSDASILDFYEVDDLPVAINRQSNEGWVWDDGSWTSDPSLTLISYTEDLQITQDDFVHRFPGAALALLDGQQTRRG